MVKVLGSINPDNHYPLYMFMYIIIMYALENNSAFLMLYQNINYLLYTLLGCR